MLRSHWMIGALLVLLIAAPAMSQQPSDKDKSPKPNIVKLGDYWLGIECYSVMPALRSHLNLLEKQGLLVVKVVKESPAAKAGIAQYDILLRAGAKPLTDPRDLLAAIDVAKNTKLKIELIRGGKPLSIEVTPGKRPEQMRGMTIQVPGQADLDTVQKWMEGIAPGQEGEKPGLSVQFRVLQPGAIMSKDGFLPKTMNLPANMSIVIAKLGDQPAKITVKRGDEKWELTEKEIDKLPADVRPAVEQMLGRGVFGIVGGGGTFVAVPGMAVPPPPPPEVTGMTGLTGMTRIMLPDFGSIEKRLDEMNRRMEKLSKMMEKLSKGHDRPEAAEKHKEK